MYTNFHFDRRPIWMEYPEDSKTFGMDDEYLLGKNFLSQLWIYKIW